MSETTPTGGDLRDFSREEVQSALFAQLVMQQSSMAMMLMGKTPHPETGQTFYDLESARMFIEQLEMLQSKTRGNLNKAEEAMFNQTLMAVRMAFVEATDHPPSNQKPPDTLAGAKSEPKLPASEAEHGEDSKKRFSKKFDL
jgi:hypothetical protein